jgi:hypothetical protein
VEEGGPELAHTLEAEGYERYSGSSNKQEAAV